MRKRHYKLGTRIPNPGRVVEVTIGGYHYARLAEYSARCGRTMRQAIEDFLVMGWCLLKTSMPETPEPPETPENQPDSGDNGLA